MRIPRCFSITNCSAAMFAILAVGWIACVAQTASKRDWNLATLADVGNATAFLGNLATALALYFAGRALILQREDIERQVAQAQNEHIDFETEGKERRRTDAIRTQMAVLESSSHDIDAEIERVWTNIRHNENLSTGLPVAGSPKEWGKEVGKGWLKYLQEIEPTRDDLKKKIRELRKDLLMALFDSAYRPENSTPLQKRVFEISENWHATLEHAREEVFLEHLMGEDEFKQLKDRQ